MQGVRVSLDGHQPGGCVFFVFSSSQQDNQYRIQMDMLQDDRRTMDEHEIVLAEIFEQGNSRLGQNAVKPEESEYLRRQFNVLPGQFKVLLMGRDSRIKLLAESFVSSQELFLRLDTANLPRETAVL